MPTFTELPAPRLADFRIDLLPSGELSVNFPYDPVAVSLIKLVPGRRWHPERKFWSIPPANLRSFREIAAKRGAQLSISERVQQALNLGSARRDALAEVKADESPLELPTATEPRPFQYAGVRFLKYALHNFHGALLADDMGLGKTFQALAIVALHEKLQNVLVLCPATLKLNWQAEIQKHFPELTCTVIEGTPRQRAQQYEEPTRLKIANYELLLRDVDLRVRPWDLVIADELTMLKSYKAKRTKAAKKLRSRYRLGLSGIPLENRLEELHSVMDFCIPGLLGSGWVFRQEHCVVDQWGGVRGYRGIEQVREKIAPYYLRRRKAEVLTELPDKVYTDHVVELSSTEWHVYDAVRSQIRQEIEENPKMKVSNVLTKLLRLKQATGDIRLLGEERHEISTKMKTVADLLAGAGEHRLVVFTQFAEMAKLLAAHFEAPLIAGEVSKPERQRIIDDFQRGEQPLLVSTEAGAYGVTLTAADIVVHYDLPWNPAKMRQREDRLHRLGQRNSVQVVKLKARHTVDEKIEAIIYRKSQLISAVLDEDIPDEPAGAMTKQQVLSLLWEDEE